MMLIEEWNFLKGGGITQSKIQLRLQHKMIEWNDDTNLQHTLKKEQKKRVMRLKSCITNRVHSARS